MTPADLRTWIDSRGGIRPAARDLDISTPRLYRMMRGEVRIPRYIELACKALDVYHRND